MQMSYVRKLLSTNTIRENTRDTRDTREEEPKAGRGMNAKSGDTCLFLPCTFCCCAIVFHLSREIYALPDAPDCLLARREAVHYPWANVLYA